MSNFYLFIFTSYNCSKRTVMDSEKYDLNWKTFPEHLIEVFKELGEEGHFADVILVSDDQIQIPANKVVLNQ